MAPSESPVLWQVAVAFAHSAQGVALCWNAVAQVVFLDVSTPAHHQSSAHSPMLSRLQALLSSKSIAKIWHNAGEHLPAVHKARWELQGKLEDVAVAAWLLWPDRETMSPSDIQVNAPALCSLRLL